MMPCMTRAIWSAPPPVPAGTMISMGLVGSHAWAGKGTANMGIANRPPTQMAARLMALVRISSSLEPQHGRSFRRLGFYSYYTSLHRPWLHPGQIRPNKTGKRQTQTFHICYTLLVGRGRGYSPRRGVTSNAAKSLTRRRVWLRG